MNTCSSFLVHVACLMLVSAWSVPCGAQGKDGSLTSDFKELSPKERSKIAAKETQEAASDSGYQLLMQQADAAFREGLYEDALAAFQKARTLRPYNVYPKVKIQDLQALIKRRDQELSEQRPAIPPPSDPVPAEVASHPVPVSPEQPVTTPIPPSAPPATPDAAATTPAALPFPPAKAEPMPIEQGVPPTPAKVKSPAETPKPTPPDLPAASSEIRSRLVVTPAAEVEPATLGERVYLEAGATVTERTVEDEGRTVVYKKVVHPWGQTYHFKDGLAISDREWNDRFNP